MKTTVLKASQKAAEDLFAEITTTDKGKKVFKRTELPDLKGFEVSAPYKENGEWVRNPETGKLKRKVILRFTNVPAPKLEYDENIISIG